MDQKPSLIYKPGTNEEDSFPNYGRACVCHIADFSPTISKPG